MVKKKKNGAAENSVSFFPPEAFLYRLYECFTVNVGYHNEIYHAAIQL
jgi:hypothetical protein